MSVVILSLLLMTAAPADVVTIPDAIRLLRNNGTVVVGGEEICSGRQIAQFYERRAARRAWGVSSKAALIAELRAAADDGLDPDDYHLEAIANLRSGDLDALDLLLTDAFLLFGSDLLTGRVDPRTVTPTWCLPSRAGDVVAALETAVQTGRIDEAIARLRPSHRAYLDLRRQLASLRAIADAGGWPVVAGGPPLRPGDSGERVAMLSRRLQASADLPCEEPRSELDDELQTAVRRFQRRHGLDEDGVAGARTLAALNVPVTERIAQVILNLERLRWLPEPGTRYAVINIAAFEMVIVDQDRQPVRMRVVVGKPFQSTPVFSSRITRIVFSPSWNVPDSIARNEIRPRLDRDPGYLRREHMQVTAGGRIRQLPGPWNALGRVKFVAPNDHGVYLHDTPVKALFDRTSRAFSHGCMRLERPLDLAEYLLAGAGWTRERIEEAAITGKELTVTVPDPLPLHVLYWTSWVGDDGMLQFRKDIYGRDAALRAAMTRIR